MFRREVGRDRRWGLAVVIATVRGGAGNPLLLTGAAAHEPRVPALVNRGSGSGRQPGHDQRLELHCPTGLGGRERLEPGRPGVLVGHPGLHDETSSAAWMVAVWDEMVIVSGARCQCGGRHGTGLRRTGLPWLPRFPWRRVWIVRVVGGRVWGGGAANDVSVMGSPCDRPHPRPAGR